MKRLGWDSDELERRRKSDPSKVAIARRLRSENNRELEVGSQKHGDGHMDNRSQSDQRH